MPVRTKDYPIYTYDEPAKYSDFSGGINTDPSNEHLLENELRDCVNMTYLSGALVKRKGAKKLCDISCEDDLKNIQGIFLFTYRITYIVLAADGKLYQGIFNDSGTISLTRLQIVQTKINNEFMFDEEDVFAGIEEKQPSEILNDTNHEGYIQTYFKNIISGEEYLKNERGSYESIANGSAINEGDVFTKQVGLLEKRYLCIKTFAKEYWYPGQSDKWEEIGTEWTKGGKTYYAATLSQEDINELKAEREGFEYFSINDLRQWNTSHQLVVFNNKFYKCVIPHYNRYNSLTDTEFFVDISSESMSYFVENSYLLFQNYRKVEAATINNNLYIATGTRIVEVYLDSNDLKARPVHPYLCNFTEVSKIGYNYLSPYPELAVASQKDTVTTSITGVKVKMTVGGRYLLTPVMNLQIGDDVSNYYFKWEKLINGTWYTIIPFKSQKSYLPGENGSIRIEKQDFSSLEVDDADKYLYRCTFAKSFELETTVVNEFDITRSYTKGEYVVNNGHIYVCIRSYSVEDYGYPTNSFDINIHRKRPDYESEEEQFYSEYVQAWDEVFDLEMVPYMYTVQNDNSEFEEVLTTTYDYIINKADGEYFGSAVSVLFDNNLKINDNFTLIHSCTKVIADGNKLLFYADRFNSGMWFKTIINNPGYITDRGNLSFKTNKNEAVIKVVPFQGNILVFANSENIGGSIHLVTGNGDDYDDESGYYSPYQRRTINASITSTNPDSIQICDNIVVFKYFDRIYYINASDLNNDTVKVTPCNDRVLNNEGEVQIPWSDDDCITEVTRDYYGIIWKEKYIIDEDGELYLEHPGIRVKMYYKMLVEHEDKTYSMPWLRDESYTFNVKHILYVKGKPVHLFNNLLLSYDENFYLDIDKQIECTIHMRAVDLNYESFFKLIENCLVSFHRNQFNKIDLDVIIKNEAGHVILDSKSKRFVQNDLGALFVGKKVGDNVESSKIGKTIQDTKLFNTINKFPCLFADTVIKAVTSGSFTFSGITYSYTSIDMPDSTPSETYTNIIRPKED